MELLARGETVSGIIDLIRHADVMASRQVPRRGLAERDGQIIRVLNTEETAAELRKRIRAHLKSQETPELADVRIVRSRSDLNPMMPEFVHSFLNFTLD